MRNAIATTTMLAVLAVGGSGLAARTAQAKDTAEAKDTDEQATTEKTEKQGQNEISAEVLGIEGKTLWLQGDEGEAIPIQVTHQTMLQGERVKDDQRIKGRLEKSFQPGQEVRASFDVKQHGGKYENQAISIDKQ